MTPISNSIAENFFFDLKHVRQGMHSGNTDSSKQQKQTTMIFIVKRQKEYLSRTWSCSIMVDIFCLSSSGSEFKSPNMLLSIFGEKQR